VDLTPEIILAGVAAVGAIVSALQSRAAARKDVVVLLQNEVARDHERIEKLEQERNTLAEMRYQLEQERNGLKANVESLLKRVTDTESRLARAEQRAGEAERQAGSFREDVIRLGEEMNRERIDSQNKINKLVLIVQQLADKLKALGADPDIDMEVLKRMSTLK
jgi:chromosome segregation ATPase